MVFGSLLLQRFNVSKNPASKNETPSENFWVRRRPYNTAASELNVDALALAPEWKFLDVLR